MAETSGEKNKKSSPSNKDNDTKQLSSQGITLSASKKHSKNDVHKGLVIRSSSGRGGNGNGRQGSKGSRNGRQGSRGSRRKVRKPGQSSKSKLRNPAHGRLRLSQPDGMPLLEGPHHGFAFQFFRDIPGNEYFSLYLWLMKDYCWSQLNFHEGWVIGGIVFGTAAVLWTIGVFIGAMSYRLYGDAWISFAICLWVKANYIWMIFEFYGLWFTDNLQDAEHYENMGREINKYLMICVVFMMIIFYAILIPNHVFDIPVYEKHPLPATKKRLDATNPLCPLFCVKNCGNDDFQIYSGLHILFWSLKDCFWAFNQFESYVFAFVITMFFVLDLFFRQINNTLQYINIIHTIIVAIWLSANGIWAIGELTTEMDTTDEANVNFFIFRQYSFWGPLEIDGVDDPDLFLNRRVAGWLFLVDICILVLFYIHWIIVTLTGKVISYDEYLEQFTLDHVTELQQQEKLTGDTKNGSTSESLHDHESNVTSEHFDGGDVI